MPLITRLGRLFRADFHTVLDHIEEPDSLLRQAVREMEDALEQDKQHLQLLQHEQADLSRRGDELGQSASALEEELDVCFAANKDDLARGLIRRRLETQALKTRLEKRGTQLQREISGLQERVTQNHKQLDSMRQKLELLVREPTGARYDCTTNEISVRDEDVEVAFLREQQRRARA